MSNCTKSPNLPPNIKDNIQFDRESKINIHSVQSSEDQAKQNEHIKDQQQDQSDCMSPLKFKQKKTKSETKITQVFSEPKSTNDISLKLKAGRYKDLINISEKRMAQSLKRVAFGIQTEKESKKMKNFQMPFSFISQSVDLGKLNSENKQKSFTSPKMPDLLKIKLKKELQTIQKNQKHNKPHFMRNHNKSHLKKQNAPLVFLDYQIDMFDQQKRHQRAKEKARKNIINERKFNNFKKVEKKQRNKISITISHHKDAMDFKQWQKRTIIEDMKDMKYLGNQRNHAKFSRLLEYVKKPEEVSLHQSPQRRKSRIKTESVLYSSLIGADVNLLQLEGTKIGEDISKGYEPNETSMMLIKSKIRNGRTTPIDMKPKLSMFNKLINSECVKLSKKEDNKNYEITPWMSFTQQVENGLD